MLSEIFLFMATYASMEISNSNTNITNNAFAVPLTTYYNRRIVTRLNSVEKSLLELTCCPKLLVNFLLALLLSIARLLQVCAVKSSKIGKDTSENRR